VLEVGDAALGEGLGQARVVAQRLVDLVELVDGHVRLLAGAVLPRDDAVAGDRDDRLVGPAVGAVPAEDLGRAVGRAVAGEGGLGRLAQLDQGEAEALAGGVVATQGRDGGPDLVRGQGVQRVPDGRARLDGLSCCHRASSRPAKSPSRQPIRDGRSRTGRAAGRRAAGEHARRGGGLGRGRGS
jgi:hypothetical protein